jgi:hypothetical protein
MKEVNEANGAIGSKMGWSLSIESLNGIRIHLTYVLFLVWVGIAFWNEGGEDRKQIHAAEFRFETRKGFADSAAP